MQFQSLLKGQQSYRTMHSFSSKRHASITSRTRLLKSIITCQQQLSGTSVARMGRLLRSTRSQRVLPHFQAVLGTNMFSTSSEANSSGKVSSSDSKYNDTKPMQATPASDEPLTKLSLADILAQQEHTRVYTCSASTPVQDAVRKMKQHNISALIVISEDKVMGILSERDYIDRITHGSFPPEDVTAEQIMTHHVISGQPSTLAIDAVQLMLRRQFRHLPVMTSASAANAKIGQRSSGADASGSSGSEGEDISIKIAESASEQDGDDIVMEDDAKNMPIDHLAGVVSLRGAVRGIMRVLQDAEIHRQKRQQHRENLRKQRALEQANKDHNDNHNIEDPATVPGASFGLGSGDAEETSPSNHRTFVRETAYGPETMESDSNDSDESDMEIQDADQDEPAHMIFTKTLEDVLDWQKKNGRELLLNTQIDDYITVMDAVNEMATQNMSCVAVVDDEGQLRGVFTARDYLFRVVAADIQRSENASEEEDVVHLSSTGRPKHGEDRPLELAEADADEDERRDDSDGPTYVFDAPPDSAQLLVTDVMTTSVKTARPYWTVAKAANVMLRRNFRHLAVIHPETRQILGMVSLSDMLRVMVAETAEDRRVRVRRISDYFNINMLLGRRRQSDTTKSTSKDQAETAPIQYTTAAAKQQDAGETTSEVKELSLNDRSSSTENKSNPERT